MQSHSLFRLLPVKREQLKSIYFTPCSRVPFPGGTSAFVYLITHNSTAKLEEERLERERQQERGTDMDALDYLTL